MTVVSFPSAPSPQSILATIYKLAAMFPRWSLEMVPADDGSPYVSATKGGAVMTACWDGRCWAVEDSSDHLLSHSIVTRSPDLATALEEALAA